jgi:putative ABC transport system permease protein
MLDVVSIFVSIILGFLIVYANNFLIRRRKKELGLYMTLGMSKGKISKLLLVETIMIGVISLVIGLVIAVFASQLLSVGIAKMFEANMDSFKFVFSKAAVIKTCIYFGIIYGLVMIFNMITISRYKLINLINANKKNEKIKVKNKFITFILFTLSILCIGYSYYLLKHNALIMMDKKFIYMIIAGSIGTLLFFASLSGFLLRAIQLNKRIYFKDLNMFVLRQINSRINTSTISMTLICIMLLLTIGILSGAMSLNSSFNSDLTENNLTDISLVNYVTLDEGAESNKEEILDLEKRFKEDKFDISKYLKEYVQYNIYNFNDNGPLMSNFLTKEDVDALKKEYGEMISVDGQLLEFIKESEFNKLMELSNRADLKVNLNQNEYVMVANFEKLMGLYNNNLKNGRIIKINGKDYIPQKKQCINVAMQNYNMDSNTGVIIVKDNVITDSSNTNLIQNVICGNYLVSDDKLEQVEKDFSNDIKTFYKTHEAEGLYKPYERDISKVSMKESSVGLSAVLTFLGLYLGIIFSITSAAVLAIQQLSQSSDNKERYEILRKIGADTKIINRSLFIQIAIYFMLPLSLALVHSVVALTELNKLISMFGHIDLTKNIAVTASFIILVYGGYFIATYIASKSIIKDES